MNVENGVTFSSTITQGFKPSSKVPTVSISRMKTVEPTPLPVANASVNPNKEFPARSYLITFDYVLDNYTLQLCQQVIVGVLEPINKFNSHSILTPNQQFP